MRRAVALGLALGLLGCGGAGGDADGGVDTGDDDGVEAAAVGEATGGGEDPADRDAAGGATDAGADRDTAGDAPGGGAERSPTAALPEPEPLPTLPGEGEPRVYRVRLVNRLAAEALVYARAGARRVVLDTVPGRDSVLVDIRLRADRVDLEAEDGAGGRLSSVTLDLAAGDVHRWVIVRRGDRPERARVALVPAGCRAYPRIRSEAPRG